MFKRLSLIGVFCIGLMALWGSSAHALGLGGWGVSKCPLGATTCGSPIYVDLSWFGVGNADKTLTEFTVLLTPNTSDPVNYPTRVLFRNPGENTGGTSSVNFDDGEIPVSGGSVLFPSLSGKGKANSQTIFGDCDVCTGRNLPDDGKLWFLYDFNNECGSADVPPESADDVYYLGIINCVKLNIVERFKPNTSWWPFAVEIDNLNLYLEAFVDGDKKLTGNFVSCKINTENQYICETVDIVKIP
jgi:hypothetical protein